MGSEFDRDVHWLRKLKDEPLRHRSGPTGVWTWYDPFTWQTGGRSGLYTAIAYSAAHYIRTHLTKQPAFTGLLTKTAWGIPIVGASYFLGQFYDYHMGLRDRIIDHYVQLHPQDFEHLNPESGRKYRDILLPWYPIRTQQTSNIRLGLPPRGQTETH